MKKLAFSLLTSLFLVLVAGQSLTAQEKYTLKSGYASGKYEKVMENTIDSTGEAMGAKNAITSTTKIFVAIDAAEKSADGTQKVTAGITRHAAKLTITAPMAWVDEYDKSVPVPNNMPMPYPGKRRGLGNVMAGLKITTVYDQDGNPIKSEGADEFFNKLPVVDPQFPKEEAEMHKARMTHESGQITVDSNFIYYGVHVKMPKAPVAVGETWTSEGSFELPTMGGQYKTNVEHTLTEVKTENGRKIAVITSKMAVNSKEPKPVAGIPGMTITKVDVSADSIAAMDIESGMILKNTDDMVFEMEGAAQGIIMKGSGKIKSTVTTTPKAQ
ncbi:MAG: DUF6263 family protein [Planctomycetaceae bacterium]|nr:DUF6263 family protein [Planctomycetaceae bacterium]